MDALIADIRYGFRTWLRNPTFALVAVLTLALGIGANVTMFSIVNAILLRPLPFPDPDRLVTVWKARIDNPESLNIVSLPDYRDWQERSTVFEDLAVFDSAGRGYNLTGQGEAEQVPGVRVTASFFDVLGVRPLLGRTFHVDEEQPGRDRVVVLSYGLWQRRYGADPTLIGRTIQIDSLPFTVVGVMPPQFQFQFWSGPRQLWVPAGWTVGDQERGSESFVCIGRLRPGVALATARSQMDGIGRAIEREFRGENAGLTARIVPVRDYGVSDLRPALAAMLGVVGFVLLISCVNVANLMLARAAARQRELAIRCAVGAGRGRILRQLFTESLLLALAGGLAGLLIAVWTTSLLAPTLPENLRFTPLRPLDGLGIDGAVLAFTFGLSCLSAILFGLAPAAAALRGDVADPLKDHARGSIGGGRGRLRHALVASEVAMTLVTLAGAGLMILSVARVLGVDPGLDPSNVLVMQMSLPQEDLYYGPPADPRFCDELTERVGGVPGVVSVGAIAHLPLAGGSAGRGIAIEGRADPGPGKRPGAGYSVACPGILQSLGVRLVAGREFTSADTLSAPPVAVINETFARRFWPGEDAVGKRFKIGPLGGDNPWLTVVGVMNDVRHWGLDNDVDSSFLRPYTQAAWPSMTVVTRTVAAPLTFVNPVKQALARVEPEQPVSGVRTMEQVIQGSVGPRRFPMLLLSGFALLALVLAAVGIGGVVAYSVIQRTPEIGVRMAVGAQAADILRLVVGHTLSWTILGILAGLIASAALLRLLGAMLYGVSATDPWVLGAVALVLMAVALGASLLPARRATRVNPVIALRAE